MSSTRCTVNRIAAALLAVTALALSAAAWAEDPGRLRLAALVEEADLLLEELAGLQPVIERLRVDGERLAAAETALRAELAGLEREIVAYNEAAGALAEAARQHRARCPRESDDSGLIERCNAAGAELMDRYAFLERQRAELAERRQALNQRIDQHNAVRIAWQADKRDNGPRIDTNESDANRWVGSARGFMVSDAFAALARDADGPVDCAELRVSDANAYHGTEGLKSLHACLQAVRAALR